MNVRLSAGKRAAGCAAPYGINAPIAVRGFDPYDSRADTNRVACACVACADARRRCSASRDDASARYGDVAAVAVVKGGPCADTSPQIRTVRINLKIAVEVNSASARQLKLAG